VAVDGLRRADASSYATAAYRAPDHWMISVGPTSASHPRRCPGRHRDQPNTDPRATEAPARATRPATRTRARPVAQEWHVAAYHRTSVKLSTSVRTPRLSARSAAHQHGPGPVPAARTPTQGAVSGRRGSRCAPGRQEGGSRGPDGQTRRSRHRRTIGSPTVSAGREARLSGGRRSVRSAGPTNAAPPGRPVNGSSLMAPRRLIHRPRHRTSVNRPGRPTGRRAVLHTRRMTATADPQPAPPCRPARAQDAGRTPDKADRGRKSGPSE